MIIVHRCTTCQHPGFYHRHGLCSAGFCPCDNTVLGPSEIMPTYRMGTREEVLEVVEPGTYWNASSDGPAGSATRMCDCTECRELYDNDSRVLQADGFSW
jgi:hypothetical protein